MKTFKVGDLLKYRGRSYFETNSLFIVTEIDDEAYRFEGEMKQQPMYTLYQIETSEYKYMFADMMKSFHVQPNGEIKK